MKQATIQANKEQLQAYEQARQKVFLCMAVNETNNKIDEESKQEVLNKHSFKISKSNRDISEGETIIKKPSQDYLMSDEDFKTYCELSHKERTARGLKIPDYNTTADHESRPQLRKAENEFIDLAISILPNKLRGQFEKMKDDIKLNATHRNKFLDLNLRLNTEELKIALTIRDGLKDEISKTKEFIKETERAKK